MQKDIKAMNAGNLNAYKEADVEHNFASVPGWGDNSYYQKRLFQKINANPKKNGHNYNNDNIFNSTQDVVTNINNKVHYGMSYFLGDNEQLFYQVGNGRTQRNNFRVNTNSKSMDHGNLNSIDKTINAAGRKAGFAIANVAQTNF